MDGWYVQCLHYKMYRTDNIVRVARKANTFFAHFQLLQTHKTLSSFSFFDRWVFYRSLSLFLSFVLTWCWLNRFKIEESTDEANWKFVKWAHTIQSTLELGVIVCTSNWDVSIFTAKSVSTINWRLNTRRTHTHTHFIWSQFYDLFHVNKMEIK